MLKFEKRIRDFLEGTETNKNPYDATIGKLERIPKSVSNFIPGDILTFLYEGKVIIALVVATRRGNGHFISSQNNLLVSCYKLSQYSSIVEVAIKTLYKRRSRAHYDYVKSRLRMFFPTDTFRTYKLRNMQNLHRIEVER